MKLGFISAVLSSGIGVIYSFLYYRFLVDFSSVLPIWKVAAGLISFTLLFFYVHQLFLLWIKQFPTFWFSLTFSLGSFVSIIYPMIERVYVDDCEFYPGFVIPLHFLPILMFLTFNKYTTQR